MTIRILRVLAQIEEEISPNLERSVVGGFYGVAREKMEEYISDFEIDSDTLDTLVNLTEEFYSKGNDLEDSALNAAEAWVDRNEHYKDLANSAWFGDMQALARKAVGYLDVDGANEFKDMPAGLPYLQKEQMLANEELLYTAILDGLRDGEVMYLEDAIRGFLREFDEDYVEREKQVGETDKEQDEVPEEQEDSLASDFLQEPEDFSGRFANAAV